MSSQTPRLSSRISGSPTPCRSPSPDIIIKSSLLITKQIQHVALQPTKPIKPISQHNDELNHLRIQNKKLKQIISSNIKGNSAQHLNSLIEEKDRLIADLKQQIHNSDGRSSKGLSLMNSTHKRQEQGKIREQGEFIKKLRERILQLEVDNENLKKKKSNSPAETPKHKPVKMDDPVPYFERSDFSNLSESRVESIKQKISSELNIAISSFSKKFISKLEQLENRLKVIDNKLEHTTSLSQSGHKRDSMTGGNFTSDRTPYGLTSTYNPEDHYPHASQSQSNNLQQRIMQLESQILQVRGGQSNLRRRISQLENDIQIKDSQIKILKEQIELRTRTAFQTNNQNEFQQERMRLAEQNMSIKQSLTRLTSQVVNLKNNQTNYKKDNLKLKQELQQQRNRNISISPAASIDYDFKIRQLTSTNQLLENEGRALRDTLSQVRKALEENQSNNFGLQNANDNLKLQNSNLKRQVDSLIDQRQNTERETISQKSKISELELKVGNIEYLNSQLISYKAEKERAQQTIRDLSKRISDAESGNINLQNQLDRAIFENESLKRTINTNNRENLELIQNSDHTKQIIRRLNEEKSVLEIEISRLKSQLRNNESNISLTNQRINNMQSQKRAIQTQNRTLKDRLNESDYNLSLSKSDRERLLHEIRLIEQRKIQLENELSRSKFDNGKETLLIQIQSLTTRLAQAELSALNFRTLEQQRNNQLQNALYQLAEVKTILSRMNFEGVESFIKQLQVKDHNHQQEKYEVTQRYVQQNQKLKKDMLGWSCKYSQQKQKADRLTNEVNLLQATNRNLNQKIQRLQAIINEYKSQNVVQTQPQTLHKYRQAFDSYSSNDTEIEKSIKQIDSLREPVQQAVSRLDKIAEKIQSKLGNKRNKLYGSGTHTYSNAER